MVTEVQGMKVTISADVSQAIRAIQDFHNRFKSIANSISSTTINASINVTNFVDSISDIGSMSNISQMKKMQETLEEMSKPPFGHLEKTAKLEKEHNKALKEKEGWLKKITKSWKLTGIVAAAALYGIIRMSSLAQMWLSELSGIMTYFIDTALAPLAPFIEAALGAFWAFSDWFSGLDPIIQGAVGAIGLFVIAGGAITAFITWLTGATGLAIITGAFEFLVGALVAAGAVIGLPLWAVIAVMVIVAATLAILWVKHEEIIALIGALWDWLGKKAGEIWNGFWTTVNTVLGDIKNILKTAWDGFWAMIDTASTNIKTTIKNTWDSILGFISDPMTKAYNFVKDIVDKIKNMIVSIPGVQTAINIAQSTFQAGKSILGSYAQGTDSVPTTGTYLLHAGEQVIPKGETNNNSTTQSVVFNVTNNINNPIMKSDADIRNLANQLSDFWKSDMQRYVRGVV